MIQALTWLIVLLAILLMIRALVGENDRRRRRTVAEWESEHAAGKGLTTQFIRAGALGLEGMMLVDDKRAAAIAFKKDEEQGTTKTGTKGDDRDRTKVSDDGES